MFLIAVHIVIEYMNIINFKITIPVAKINYKYCTYNNKELNAINKN